MSEKINNIMEELNLADNKVFNDSRIECTRRFKGNFSMFKRKITQSMYWSASDKDLANQLMRDEKWFFGMKFWDTLKLVDHGFGDIKDGIGFRKSK